MRTTIDIDEKLVRAAWAIGHPKSKRELFEIALREMIRREHLKRLADMLGKVPMITRSELLRMRRRG